MKVLLYAHRLEVGGTQVNAIELADALQRLHAVDITLFATTGPLVELARSKGLHYVAAPDASMHPSLARVRALSDAVRKYVPDIVHAWDWWQCLDACCALHMGRKVPLVVTDMMMDLTRVLPKRLPTTFGTPEILRRAKSAGRSRTELLLPPVDVTLNRPGIVDGHDFRRQHGIALDAPLLVTVSRLSNWMKSESLIRSIEAVGDLGHHSGITFAIVGDGGIRASLESMAHRVNAQLKRRAIVFSGALIDPRAAYQAADIVIGMGGSALRAMAFAKPVVIVGEGGFSEIFDESTVTTFYDQGMYGRAAPARSNDVLVSQLDRLLGDGARRLALGEFSRSFVMKNHSLEELSGRLAAFYMNAITERVSAVPAALDAFRTAAVYFRERRFFSRSRDRFPIEEVKDMPALARPPVEMTIPKQ